MYNRQIAYTEEITVRYEETQEKLFIKNHYHNTYEMIFITEGKAIVRINSRYYEAGPGSLIFISHLESHEVEVLCYPYKRYYLLVRPQLFQSIIDDQRLGSIFKNRPGNFIHMLVLNEAEIADITLFFIQIKKELDSELDFKIKSAAALMHLLVIRLYRDHRQCFPLTDTTGQTNIIYQIQKYIEEHYLEPVTLKSIADIFYLDMYYLSRLFKKISGFPFKEYVIKQRLSAAKELLVNSDISITEVCSSSGFCNVNHFIRIFKQNEGTSPYQYRIKYRKTNQIP